jgi:UDP-glucose 4-epimerase
MILLTGATGFVGNALLNELVMRDQRVRVATRYKMDKLPPGVDQCLVEDLSVNTDWSASLVGIDSIVHMAARVHQMEENPQDSLHKYRQTNVEGSLTLARQAAASGVRRFIFMSSIKVNGESTLPGKPFLVEDPPRPVDPYGVTKLEAEQGLAAISSETGMEVVVIRPPLVYGRGAKGNFQTLGNWVKRGIPLPLGFINNKRSFVAIDNLVDFIITCIHHPKAGNETFLVGDGKDISTTELLRKMKQATHKSTCLVPVPSGLIVLLATLLGKRAVAQRLCGFLQVDISKARALLGWSPPVSIEQGLRGALMNEHDKL